MQEVTIKTDGSDAYENAKMALSGIDPNRVVGLDITVTLTEDDNLPAKVEMVEDTEDEREEITKNTQPHAALWVLSQAEEPITSLDLGELLSLTPGSSSAALSRVAKSGCSIQDSSTKRHTHQISEHGREVIEELGEPKWRAMRSVTYNG